jgi:hypothetical protein
LPLLFVTHAVYYSCLPTAPGNWVRLGREKISRLISATLLLESANPDPVGTQRRNCLTGLPPMPNRLATKKLLRCLAVWHN